MPRNYWMIVTSLENFRITRGLGFTVQGLKPQHQRKMQRIGHGDRILYYIGGARYFAATATATSRYFEDSSPVWKKEGASDLTFRVRIQPEMVLDEEEFIDARQVAPRLDYVRKWAPEDWYRAFAQSNLHLLPKKDFLLVEEEMRKIKSRVSSSPQGQVVAERKIKIPSVQAQSPLLPGGPSPGPGPSQGPG